MPEDPDLGDLEDDVNETVTIPKRDLRNLREKARRAEAAERELAFTGIIPDDHPGGAMFKKGYDGPMERDAVKAEWDKVFGQGQQTSGDGISAEEQRAHQQFAAAQTGAASPPAPDSEAALVTALENASNTEEVLEIARRAGRMHVPE